jgi:hypothetical protein
MCSYAAAFVGSAPRWLLSCILREYPVPPLLPLQELNFPLLVYALGHPRWGRGCQASAPLKRNLKNTDFVDNMMSKVLFDSRFSLNQPPKSADNIINYIIKTYECMDNFSLSVRVNFLCYLTSCRFGDFEMIFIT